MEAPSPAPPPLPLSRPTPNWNVVLLPADTVIAIAATALLWPGVVASPNFMAQACCYMWNANLNSLHVVSDALILLSYLSIPLTVAHFVRRRRDMPFNCTFLQLCERRHEISITLAIAWS